jgi:outer membrane protein assembly factor BamE
MKRLAAASVALLAAALLPGCAYVSRGWTSMAESTPTFLQPYRPDMHQGNIITQEMVEQIRVGMTREQVRFMLGTPMLTSAFHQARWDYVYYLNRRSGEVQKRNLVIVFKDNRVDSFRADPMPTEAEADMLILGRGAWKPAPVPPAQLQGPTAPDISTPGPGSD